MSERPRIIIENKIPFIKGRLEEIADVEYLSPDEFSSTAIADADALIVRTRTRCNAQLLDKSRVKFIATATIGTDHIDTQWCRQKGITLRNAPGCNAPAVAQYVWASILHLGIDPRQITIGIVGCGNVGSIVAEWGERLGAKVLICDPPKAILEPHNAHKYIDLDDMLPQCDIVTLHTPLTKTGDHPTYHLISAPQLSLMRPGAVLINAARGAVTDTTALLEYSDSKHLKLVIDCWEGEPFISHELLQKAIIATPHIAGYSIEGKQRATRMVVEATFEYLKTIYPTDHNLMPVITAKHQNNETIYCRKTTAPDSSVATQFLSSAIIKSAISDLASDYTPSDSTLSPQLTAQRIAESYNPLIDTQTLKSLTPNPLHDTTHLLADNPQSLADDAQSFADNPQLFADKFEQLRAGYNYRHEPNL